MLGCLPAAFHLLRTRQDVIVNFSTVIPLQKYFYKACRSHLGLGMFCPVNSKCYLIPINGNKVLIAGIIYQSTTHSLGITYASARPAKIIS